MQKVKYQGEDIYIDIKLKNTEDDSLVDLSEFANVLAYVYTDKKTILKYSRESYGDARPIIILSNNVYYLIIETVDTLSLTPGPLIVEIKIVKTNAGLSDGKEDLIGRMEALRLEYSEIKNFGADLQVLEIGGNDSVNPAIANLVMETYLTNLNTDNGSLYYEIYASTTQGGNLLYTFKIYKDELKTRLVASTNTFTSSGTYAFNPVNGSDIKGTIEIAANYKYYWSIYGQTTQGGSIYYTFAIYKNSAKTQLVASSIPFTKTGSYNLLAQNSSGLTGYVNVKNDNYTLYWTLASTNPSVYQFRIYSDAEHTNLIAQTATFTTTGSKTISPYILSGGIPASDITGTIIVSELPSQTDDDVENTIEVVGGIATIIDDDNSVFGTLDIDWPSAPFKDDIDELNIITINPYNLQEEVTGDQLDTEATKQISSLSISNANYSNSESIADNDELNIITIAQI